MFKPASIFLFISGLLLISCNPELIPASENMLVQANEKEGPKASPPLDQIKSISQLLEDTELQDKGAQEAMIQAIAQGQQEINQYAKESYIPFILEHVEKEEPEALVALLWLMKKYTENSLLKSYKLKPETCQELLTKLEESTCDTNDGMHAYYIGKIYSSNEIQGLIPNDASKTITYYKKAISMENAEAATNLGVLYHNGMQGQLSSNAAKALKYYKLGLELGNAKAAYGLGLLYEKGMKGHLMRNAAKAIAYYKKGVSMGNADAAYGLGLLYEKGMKGQLTPKAAKAIAYYEKGVSMGNADAANNLEIFDEFALKRHFAPNTAKDIAYYEKEAIAYYEKAVSMGNADAARNLIILYEKDISGQLTHNDQLIFKTYHDTYLANNKSNYVKEGLLKFLVSNPSIKVDPSDIAEAQQGLNTFKENVETLIGLILLKQEENNATSQAMQFKDCYIIPELYPCYSALVEYLDKVRNIIPYLSKYGVMVDCIKVKKNGKRSKVIADGDHLHAYLIDGQSYICLGENNVKAGKMLMSLLEEEETVNQTVASIRKMMMQDSTTELGLRLYEQALKKLPSDYTGTVEEHIATRATETLNMLDNMQALCIQLKDIVIATTSLRNKKSMELYHFLESA